MRESLQPKSLTLLAIVLGLLLLIGSVLLFNYLRQPQVIILDGEEGAEEAAPEAAPEEGAEEAAPEAAPEAEAAAE